MEPQFSGICATTLQGDKMTMSLGHEKSAAAVTATLLTRFAFQTRLKIRWKNGRHVQNNYETYLSTQLSSIKRGQPLRKFTLLK